MESIIVYRNPVEAMVWQSIMNGDFVPVGTGLLVFFFSFLILNRLLEKPVLWFQRNFLKSTVRSYRNPGAMYLSMAIAIVLGCATTWRMWI